MGVFMDLVKMRHSCRRYASRPLEKEKIEACIGVARLAPSACNSQPWYFAVAMEPSVVRAVGKTTQHYGVNTFADQPPAFITVWETPAKLMPKVTEGLGNQFYAQGDVGITVAHLTLAAADMGLGTCVMGIYEEEPIRKLLDVPADYKLRYVVAIGYPDDGQVQPRPRKAMEEICKFVG